MTDTATPDLTLLKARLSGQNFKNLLKQKKVTKWRIYKDCKITYHTLCNWQSGRSHPSDELAVRVARYLGLIKSPDGVIAGLRRQMNTIQKQIKSLEVNPLERR
jgi:DNA-binding XRE family transcriptional regulator